MLLNLLGDRWAPIIEGLEKGMDFDINPADVNFPYDIKSIIWKKLLHACEVENYSNRYGYVCIGNFQPTETGVSVEVLLPSQPEKDDLPDEGMFLCFMKNGDYGFFTARNGSCGYNDCCVGGSYASFYVGSYDNVCQFGMDDEARRWHKILNI